MSNGEAKRRVVIVGGGVSGLSAASLLCDTGLFDVTILEAETRIGGRVHTVDYFGHKVELGAQWIHGREGNAVYEYLSSKLNPCEFKNEKERYYAPENSRIAFTSGRETSPAAYQLFKESRKVIEEVDGKVKETLNCKNESEDTLKDVTILDFAKTLWNEEYMTQHDVSKMEIDAIWNNLLVFMNITDGSHPKNASCLLYHYYDEIDTDVVIRDSYSKFLDFLRHNIPDSSIKLNSKVEYISWKPTKIGNTYSASSDGANHIQSIIQDPSIIDLESRIKNGSALCQSEKAKSKPSIINNTTVDPIIPQQDHNHNHIVSSKSSDSDYKVQVEYRDENGIARFINADHVIMTVSLGVLKKFHKKMFLPNLPKQKQECINMMGFGTIGKLLIHFEEKLWDKSDFPLYLLCDSEFGASDSLSWYKELINIRCLNSQTLVIWLTHTACNHLKQLSKHEIWQAIHNLLKNHYDINIPTPDDIVMTQWGENENFLGSYSFTAVGETLDTKKVVSDPLFVDGVPRILFAGEAMHESRFGTVDGAYLTGMREAKRILGIYQ